MKTLNKLQKDLFSSNTLIVDQIIAAICRNTWKNDKGKTAGRDGEGQGTVRSNKENRVFATDI